MKTTLNSRGRHAVDFESVAITRGTPYENPYGLGYVDGLYYIHRDNKRVTGYFGEPPYGLWMNLFRVYALERAKGDPEWLENLRGKNLKCVCSASPCHGEVYIELLEGE